jgi:methyl-accepting chemotaxis protein
MSAKPGFNKNSILWRLVLPIPLFAIVAIAAALVVLPQVIASNSIADAERAALETVNQFKELRGYYTKNVVAKAVAAGLTATPEHAQDPNSIPLPATLIHDISEVLKSRDTRIQLYSTLPFPIRAERKLDEFQQRAWSFLSTNSKATLSEQQAVDGNRTLRVAVADVMQAEACVACHNARADSPKRDWKLGDVRGVLEVNTSIEAALASGERLGFYIAAAIALIAVLLTAIAYFFGRTVSRPLLSMSNAMTRLANGDLSVSVPAAKRQDEIGEMAEAMRVFKDNAAQIESARAERTQLEAKAREDEKRMLESVSADFNSSVGGIVGNVTSAAEELRNTANRLMALANQTGDSTVNASASIDNASASAQTVAAAAEELSASINEIARQVSQSSQIAQQAVQRAQRTDQTVAGLSDAANRIGEVIHLIQDIAERTNLLALNATIEAARAGDAGKGFAVVAGEVKGLATQTARATEDISTQIAAIRRVSDESVAAIREIGEVIGQLNSVTTAISAAVEEQSSATRDIAQHVMQTSQAAKDVSSKIHEVDASSQESKSAANQVLDASNDLSSRSHQLRDEVTRFLQKLQRQ